MYVVILKTVADLESKTLLEANLPDAYPIECAEYADEATARAHHPLGNILEASAYKDFKNSLDPYYLTAIAAVEYAENKPWWKIW